ncbi:hypothetical protein ACQPUL_08515 [Clostridium butyricum]|uniref:hypothetical protein n=1 Tax=Clostridium butyricum TaxID=1492 RepID=UPI003D33BD85
MIIEEKTSGKKIDYEVSGTKLTLNDELTINLKKYEMDSEHIIDICIDTRGFLTMGVTSNTLKYVAQIVIPAREYEEIESIVDDETVITRNAVDFDINKCTLVLWGMEE